MRGIGIALMVLLAGAACSPSNDLPVKTGVAPKDAPERKTLPAKCVEALTFDDECRAAFDRIWGQGAGANEAAALNSRRASSGWGSMRSEATPSTSLGTQPSNQLNDKAQGN